MFSTANVELLRAYRSTSRQGGPSSLNMWATPLRYLGKHVRFVRYWGEGHVLSSPVNVADLWQRILEWLESFR
jgi:hypothetical protein